jgi:hypothetical protein
MYIYIHTHIHTYMQAVDAVESGQADLDEQIAVKMRNKDEEIGILLERNEELQRLLDGAEAADQLLNQVNEVTFFHIKATLSSVLLHQLDRARQQTSCISPGEKN